MGKGPTTPVVHEYGGEYGGACTGTMYNITDAVVSTIWSPVGTKLHIPCMVGTVTVSTAPIESYACTGSEYGTDTGSEYGDHRW